MTWRVEKDNLIEDTQNYLEQICIDLKSDTGGKLVGLIDIELEHNDLTYVFYISNLNSKIQFRLFHINMYTNTMRIRWFFYNDRSRDYNIRTKDELEEQIEYLINRSDTKKLLYNMQKIYEFEKKLSNMSNVSNLSVNN